MASHLLAMLVAVWDWYLALSPQSTHTHPHVIMSQHPIVFHNHTLPTVTISFLSTFNHTLHTFPLITHSPLTQSHPSHCHNHTLPTVTAPLSSLSQYTSPHLPTTGTGGGTSYGKTGGAGGGGGGGKFGSSERCPKCGGAVFMAEKIVGAGSVRLRCI